MKRGDVFLVNLNPTRGHEQQGFRPVVIVSPELFNKATGIPVVCPITTGGEFAKRIGFAVSLEGSETTGIVRCDQPKAIDLKARNGRKIEELPDSIMNEVMAKLKTIFD